MALFSTTGGVIGGTEPGAANVIAYNGQWGNMLRNHPLRTAHPPARRNKSPLRTADSTAPQCNPLLRTAPNAFGAAHERKGRFLASRNGSRRLPRSCC